MSSNVATAVLRIVVAALVVAALVATLSVVQPVELVNFFGYFTVQSNVIGAVVAVIGAVRLLRGTAPTTAWVVVRWCTATYLVLVGVVLLGAARTAERHRRHPARLGEPRAARADARRRAHRPAARARPAPARAPPAAAGPRLPADLDGGRAVRGATDGWVPYPFLSPAQGYGVVAAWAALVAGVFTGAAALLPPPARSRGPRMSGPGRRGHRPREAVRGPDGPRRRHLHHRARRDVRPARAERCRQVDDDRDPRGLPEALRRRRAACSAPTRARPGSTGRRGSASCCSRAPRPAPRRRGSCSRTSPPSSRTRAPSTRPSRRSGSPTTPGTRIRALSGGRRRRLDVALGIVGRPRAAVPRRADDRASTRRRGAASGSSIEQLEGGGHDHPAHHALPRRGRGAGRPRRGHRRRPPARHRHRRLDRLAGGARAARAVARRRGRARGAHGASPRRSSPASSRPRAASRRTWRSAGRRSRKIYLRLIGEEGAA